MRRFLPSCHFHLLPAPTACRSRLSVAGDVGYRCCNIYAQNYSSDDRQGPLALYKNLVERGHLGHDVYQEKVASQLDDLLGRLEQYDKEMRTYHHDLAEWEKKREAERRKLLVDEAETKQKGEQVEVKKPRFRFFRNWMAGKKKFNVEAGVGKMVSYLNREKKLDLVVGARPVAPRSPKGLYLYGNVGSGKTMLMDMFFSATKDIVSHRRRFHFHEAMLEINERMHKEWKNKMEERPLHSVISSWIDKLPFDTKVKDWLVEEENYKQEIQMKHILPAVADKFLIDKEDAKRGASILCFDEIQTVDVFAIVALSGIISRLLSTGTVLVATSNRAPNDLNQDGMQRDIFQDFVAKLSEHCENVLIGSEIDYRRLKAKSHVKDKQVNVHYFWPLDVLTQTEYENLWHKVINEYGGRITNETIPVMFGRKLEVPESCNGVARFSFEYLCGRMVGAADYIALAKNYHTVFISDIPMMSMRIRDKARRFITLIDELYNHHCCLICTAAASIDDLFQGTEEGTLFDLESFQFETETEDGKLRRDVLAAGNIGSGPAPAGIAALLSGQEEMFAFRRAVSRLIEMQTPLYLEGVERHHPLYYKVPPLLGDKFNPSAELQFS